MDREAVAASIKELRERRAQIPAMRDYRPQRGRSSSKDAEPQVDLTSVLGKLGGLVTYE